MVEVTSRRASRKLYKLNIKAFSHLKKSKPVSLNNQQPLQSTGSSVSVTSTA